jgi:hypothetical protein
MVNANGLEIERPVDIEATPVVKGTHGHITKQTNKTTSKP